VCNVVPPILAMALSKALTVRTWLDLVWSLRFGGPANPIFFSKIRYRLSLGFPPYHMAAPDWATSQPPIRPSHLLPCQCHIIVRTPRHCMDFQLSMPHHNAMSLYGPFGLPHGTILLVHRFVRKCQIWVTRGSL
jgi:hypothetical protein